MAELTRAEFLEQIADHVEQHVGPVVNVFGELVSEQVKLDVLVCEPTEERPCFTFVTCGMSEKPMRIPVQDPEDLALVPELRFAELLLCLPSNWPVGEEEFRDPNNFWPIRWLKRLARLPHQYQQWLGAGHTIPNGEPPEPFADNTQFSGWMLEHPLNFAEEIRKLRTPEKITNFYALIPLYAEELQLKIAKGGRALAALLDQAEVSDLLDITRPNVAKR